MLVGGVWFFVVLVKDMPMSPRCVHKLAAAVSDGSATAAELFDAADELNDSELTADYGRHIAEMEADMENYLDHLLEGSNEHHQH